MNEMGNSIIPSHSPNTFHHLKSLQNQRAKTPTLGLRYFEDAILLIASCGWTPRQHSIHLASFSLNASFLGKATPSLNSSGAGRLSRFKFTRPASALALDSPPFLGCRHNVKLLLPLSLKGSLNAPEKRGESSAARAAYDAGREEPKTWRWGAKVFFSSLGLLTLH